VGKSQTGCITQGHVLACNVRCECVCRCGFGTLGRAAYAALELIQNEGIHTSHADLLGCDPITPSGTMACLTEVGGRRDPCRSESPAIGPDRKWKSPGRPPESDSCRLPGHAPHGTPREVCFTRDMDWRTLFPPVAPLDTGYPSALEKRASKYGAAFGDRREEKSSKTEARRGCDRWWESVMALCSHDGSAVKKHISMLGNISVSCVSIRNGTSCVVQVREHGSSRKTGKTSAVARDRTEV
jgi:hypothetical protein